MLFSTAKKKVISLEKEKKEQGYHPFDPYFLSLKKRHSQIKTDVGGLDKTRLPDIFDRVCHANLKILKTLTKSLA